MSLATIQFRCNICGHRTAALASLLREREMPSCEFCGSTTRLRSTVRALSLGLFGESFPLTDFPARRDLRGIGLSEWPGYLPLLEDRFDFLNTFYHQEPFLDITAPPQDMFGTADFIISSEVFEHTPPPAQQAFDGAFALLKPGGLLVLTTPFRTDAEETEEHFPCLHEWSITEGDDGLYVLCNRTEDGRDEVFTNLCFHGGPGSTLEMRVFSRSAIERHLAEAGFVDVRFRDEDETTYGVMWQGSWSVPISARKRI